MKKSLLIFFAAAAGAYYVSRECKRARDRDTAEQPRPGAHVPLAPDAGTVEARGGAAVVVTTDKLKADVETPAVFVAPDNA